MSYIQILYGGKNVGIADQASIEPLKGCTNKCVGCYASKTTRQGPKFFEDAVLREFNEDVLRKSCVKANKDGIEYVRMSKHCDPGHPSAKRIVMRILTILSEYDIKAVFVSKCLDYSKDMSQILKSGNHILHISLGMITQTKSDEDRIKVWYQYKNDGVNSKIRITLDVTQTLPDLFGGLTNEEVIITPMRFPSKSIAEEYNAELDTNFSFTGGYYRPKSVHESWSAFSNWCGEIGEKELCCNCLTT